MNNTLTYKENPITCFLQYVIGVPRKYMNETEYIGLGEIQRLRCMRRLCQLRSQILRNFTEIGAQYKFGEYFDKISSTRSPYERLLDEGITLSKQDNLAKEVIQINNWIYGYVNEVLSNVEPELDPDTHIEWLRDLILMPNGNTVEGVRAAIKAYKDRINNYPYQMYVNWEFGLSTDEQRQLNLLRSDTAFITELKMRHTSVLSNEGAKTFCAEANNLIAIIDCENVTPQKLYSMMLECDSIKKVVMVNDENASVLWSDFEALMKKRVAVEHIMTDRINKQKSVADLVVVARIMREYYEGHADSIIICSSDSDYISVIETLPNVKFAVALEQVKSSHSYIEVLRDKKVQVWPLDAYEDEKNPLVRYAADRLGRILAEYTLDLNDIGNQVAAQLHIRSDVIDDLKPMWLETAALIKDSESGKISISFEDAAITEEPDDESEDEDNDEEERESTPVTLVVSKTKTKTKTKKKNKKAKKGKKRR